MRHAALRSGRRAFGRAALVALATVALVLPLTGAFAQSRSSEEIEEDLRDAERESEEVESELGQLRGELDAQIDELADIALSLEQAQRELEVAEGQVALAEEALSEAEDERDQAARDHEHAVQLLDQADLELAEAESKLTMQLVESFKYGSAGAQHGAMVLEILRRAEDPNSFSVGMRQLQTVIDDQDATVQQIFDLREERSGLAEEAARARGEANQAAADAQETLRVVEDLQEEAADLAASIAADEERQRQVIAGLEQSESELATTLQQVSAREDELRADFREARDREAAERAAARAAEREAARQASNDNGNGGGSGGGDGNGNGGGFPGAGGGPFIDGMVCPVEGSPNFINDWGFPRSGGRWHQGNDLFASRGTPVVAVHDATVVSWNPPSSQTALGGITVTYETADGSRWYNAHLDTIADGIEPGASVSRGQRIGTVGNTGNARTTPPHLHLGRRYGGSPVNPFPTIRQVCP